MKILVLAHNFPPESSPLAVRTYEHAKWWVKMGHRVQIVTTAPNYPNGVLYPGHRNPLLSRETVDGIDVVRVWTFLAANRGETLRSISFVSYLLSVVLQTARFDLADVVVSSSPQLLAGFSGYPVSRLTRRPWVLEIRDLWPESIVAVGAMQRGAVVDALEAVERFAYRRADHIVPVSGAFRPHIEGCGIAREKITVLHNGANLELFTAPKQNPTLAGELGLAGKFVVAYCGTLGMAHALETVLEAARRLTARDDIRFLLVGGGAEQTKLRQMRDDRNLNNVVILDRQPHERMPEIWGLANASIVHLRDTALFRTVIPSKMFEAMALGLPIVLGVQGEAERILTEAGAGIAVQPENAEAMAKAVEQLADSPGLAVSLGANGRRAVHERYDRRVIAEQYVSLLQRIVTECRT
jgi:glycosyltransferase involved in cell wall biosynthesis